VVEVSPLKNPLPIITITAALGSTTILGYLRFSPYTKKNKATVFHQKERNRREVQEGCAIDLTRGGGRWVNKQHQQPAYPGIGEEQPQSVDLLVAEEAHLEEQVSGCSHTTQASRA
jgi:hypothetical protein